MKKHQLGYFWYPLVANNLVQLLFEPLAAIGLHAKNKKNELGFFSPVFGAMSSEKSGNPDCNIPAIWQKNKKKLEIWRKALREFAQRPMSDWGKK